MSKCQKSQFNDVSSRTTEYQFADHDDDFKF
jgi:hypothetical protein